MALTLTALVAVPKDAHLQKEPAAARREGSNRLETAPVAIPAETASAATLD